MKKLNYFIRLDGAVYDEEDLNIFLDIIHRGLPENYDVKIFSALTYQQKSKLKSISLDKFFKGDFNLNVSRMFKYQETHKPLKMTGSPEMLSLENQVKKIPKGNYVLIDDDTVSGYKINVFNIQMPFSNTENIPGYTVNWIKSYLKYYGINIVETEFILRSFDEYVDVIDFKDFIIGNTNAGLVELLPNGDVVRVPYLHPFVNLTQRASVKPELADSISKELWGFNKKYNEKRKNQLRKVDSTTIKFINYILNDDVVILNEKQEVINFNEVISLLASKFS